MKLIEVTRKLIDIPSITGDEAEIGQFLASYLESLNYHVETQAVALAENTGRTNIIAAKRPTARRDRRTTCIERISTNQKIARH